MWVIVSFLACDPATGADSDPAASEPSPYIYEDTDVIVADQSPEQLAAGIEAALELVLQTTPGPIFEAYTLAMVGQTESCPNMYEDGDAYYWADQCSTENGAYFSGYSWAQDQPVYQEGWEGEVVSFYSAATIVNPDGYTFNGAGGVYEAFQTNGPESGRYWSIRGVFSYDGPELADTWVATDTSPDLEAGFYLHADYPNASRDVSIGGGISPLDGELVAASFDTFHWAEWTSCPEEPGGSVSLRTAEGQWYDVLFDGIIEYGDDEPSPEECDGCGTAYYLGEPVGQVCPNFGALEGVTP